MVLLTAVTLMAAACDGTPAEPSAVGAIAAGSLSAKVGGGKPPSLERAVLADFRCPGSSCPGTDRLFSDSAQRAWLQAAPTGKRAGDPTFEGNYVMPFQMRITVQ
jgi:hypothetical protein